MKSLFDILMALLQIAQWVILAQVIMSWLINFQVLNLRQPFVLQVWSTLNRILEPVYGRIRSVLPAVAGLDLAPLVALFAIFAARTILINNAGFFG